MLFLSFVSWEMFIFFSSVMTISSISIIYFPHLFSSLSTLSIIYFVHLGSSTQSILYSLLFPQSLNFPQLFFFWSTPLILSSTLLLSTHFIYSYYLLPLVFSSTYLLSWSTLFIHPPCWFSPSTSSPTFLIYPPFNYHQLYRSGSITTSGLNTFYWQQ